jgi:hypothetical protein
MCTNKQPTRGLCPTSFLFGRVFAQVERRFQNFIVVGLDFADVILAGERGRHEN